MHNVGHEPAYHGTCGSISTVGIRILIQESLTKRRSKAENDKNLSLESPDTKNFNFLANLVLFWFWSWKHSFRSRSEKLVSKPMLWIRKYFLRIHILPVPEFIDTVFVKTSPKRSFSVIQNERFGLVFVKTGSIISGTGHFCEHWKKNYVKQIVQYMIEYCK